MGIAHRASKAQAEQTYMSGGILSKGIDLLSTTNYAAAGGVDALLSGENPIPGALEGIRTRQTFGDVLKERGAPGWIAGPVGLMADIATPMVPGIGLVRTAKAIQIARAARLAEQGFESVDTVEDIIRGTESVGTAARIGEEVAGRELAAGRAARAGYENAPAGMEVGAARARAAEARGGADSHRLGRQALGRGPVREGEAWGWLKGTNAWVDNLIRQTESVILDHPMFQAGIGRDFVNGIRLQQTLGRRLKGGLVDRANKIVRLIGKNHVEFMQVANGSRQAASEGMEEAVRLYREMADELFEAMRSRGVHQTDEIATIAFRRLEVEDRELVMRLSVTDDVNELQRFADTEAGRLAAHIRNKGARITAGETIEKPLERVTDYIPLIPKKLDRRALGIRSHEAVSRMIQDLNPGMEPTYADAIAERVLADRRINSPDIAKMLQHQRSGWGGFLPHIHVSDPKAVLYKMINDSSDLIAGAKVWGGDWSKYGQLRSRFTELNSISRLAKDKAPPEETATALAAMDRIFNITQGIHHDPYSPVTNVVSRIADLLFLSPRTILLQPTTMANLGAMVGGGNALAAVGEFLTNPTMGRLGARLGAILPNLWHALDEREGLKIISKWNPVMKGIAGADAQQRSIAAVGGALHAVDFEEKMMKALQSGNRARAEKLANLLERRYGVDAAEILARGGEITSEEMFKIASEVANQTNFTGDVLKMPMAAQSPAGKFFLKFKQFSLQQGFFIKQLFQEGKATGDWGALLRYAAYFPWVYNAVVKATNQLRPEDIDAHDDEKQYLKNLLMIGGMGFWGDAALSLGSASEALQLGVITGANTAAVLKLGKAAINATNPFDHDPEKAWESIKPATVRQLEAVWQRAHE